MAKVVDIYTVSDRHRIAFKLANHYLRTYRYLVKEFDSEEAYEYLAKALQEYRKICHLHLLELQNVRLQKIDAN